MFSWLYVARRWPQQPEEEKLHQLNDEGFEEIFRKYLYSKIEFDTVSVTRDMSFGLSLSSLSGMPHELDSICRKGNDIFTFELKHYKEFEITKEIVFTFLGKTLDFYFKNAIYIPENRITMYLVTDNENIENSVRRLCIAFGIKLVEPKLMTMRVLEFFLRDMYAKTPTSETDLRSSMENLVKKATELRESYDFTFSDLFRFKDGKIETDATVLSSLRTDIIIEQVKGLNDSFAELKLKWDTVTKSIGQESAGVIS